MQTLKMIPSLTGFFLVAVLVTLASANEPSGFGLALENGDTNGDLERDLSDTVFLLGHLFLGGPKPVPLALCAGNAPAFKNGDTNGDTQIDVADPIYLLSWLFLDGPAPIAVCGEGFGGGIPDLILD